MLWHDQEQETRRMAGWWWVRWCWLPAPLWHALPTGQTARQAVASALAVVVRCWALACLSLQGEHGAGVQAACIHVAVVNQALHVVLHFLFGLAEVLGNLLHAVNGLALLIHMRGLG